MVATVCQISNLNFRTHNALRTCKPQTTYKDNTIDKIAVTNMVKGVRKGKRKAQKNYYVKSTCTAT